jgi:histidine ammonia-lyase
MNALKLNGNHLTLEELRDVVYERRPVLLDPDARGAVERARNLVEDLVAGDGIAYAITTGVGKLADVRIPNDQVRELQINLVRSHAVGVGAPLGEPETRAMMLLRANSLAKGYSGVRPAIIDTLCEMLNRGVHPVVPSQGSVGASGDLAPLAHLALALVGEGEVVYNGAQVSARDALGKSGMKPIQLEAKEAISLINGTQGMLGVGSLAVLAAEALADSADVIGALSVDALQGTVVAFDDRIQRVRPHPGQLQTAANLRRMLEGEDPIRDSHANCGRVQDAYSLRCMPQVHGAVRDTISYCRTVMETEANSAVDNPLVFLPSKQIGVRHSSAPQRPQGEILSGGNFHGQPLAFALDFLAIALATLAGISERRTERMVNPALSEGLPAFLAPGAGLNSGFMMLQVTAAALVAENQVLANPASAHSITTSGNKEDYVSMGMTGACKMMKIIDNTAHVLAIEAMSAAQALDFLLPLRSSKRGQQAHALIRSASANVQQDRSLAGDIGRVAKLISSGTLAAVVRK